MHGDEYLESVMRNFGLKLTRLLDQMCFQRSTYFMMDNGKTEDWNSLTAETFDREVTKATGEVYEM